jgi:hypothetical protein
MKKAPKIDQNDSRPCHCSTPEDPTFVRPGQSNCPRCHRLEARVLRMHKVRESNRIELLWQELYDRLIPISEPNTRLAFQRILKGNHHVVIINPGSEPNIEGLVIGFLPNMMLLLLTPEDRIQRAPLCRAIADPSKKWNYEPKN